MNKEEIAKFAYRVAAHNERIVVTLKDQTVYSGHFFNNAKIADKSDNLWNFVIPANGSEKPKSYILNGDDIDSIKKVQLF